jgi:hypothetical protein
MLTVSRRAPIDECLCQPFNAFRGCNYGFNPMSQMFLQSSFSSLIVNSWHWINPMVWIDAAEMAADNFAADDPNPNKIRPYYSIHPRHLFNNAMLNKCKSFTPNLPSSIGKHIESHFTKHTFKRKRKNS